MGFDLNVVSSVLNLFLRECVHDLFCSGVLEGGILFSGKFQPWPAAKLMKTVIIQGVTEK